MIKNLDLHDQKPSTSPKAIESSSLLDIIKQAVRIKNIYDQKKPETEKLIEELFFHISSFNDQDVYFGNIEMLKDSQIKDYNISSEKLPEFNNSIRIINRLFQISHGLDPNIKISGSAKNPFTKIIDIDDLPFKEVIIIKAAVGSQDYAHYLASIVNQENSSRNFLPATSPNISESSSLNVNHNILPNAPSTR